MTGAASAISVVIPNHNYGAFLAGAIDSALEQTLPPQEVIVVDDGSTDDSLAVARRYGPRVRVLTQPRQGVSAARNRGIAASRGELIALLDSDDVWRRDKLERQAALLQDPGVGMVYCLLRYVDAEGRPLGVNLPGLRGEVLKDLALLRTPGLAASGSGALVRRRCFERVGGFDPEMSTSADWDMWRRIACHDRIDLVEEPLVDYRIHGASMHLNVERFERDMLRAFTRMFEDPAAGPVRPLRRRCYANLYRMLSGSYYPARRWDKCVGYAVRSAWAWPPSAPTLLEALAPKAGRVRVAGAMGAQLR